MLTKNGRFPPAIVGIIIILAFIAGTAFGWFLRLSLETRAELAVVLDDEKAVRIIEDRTDAKLLKLNKSLKRARNEKVDGCYTNKSVPDSWFDSL